MQLIIPPTSLLLRQVQGRRWAYWILGTLLNIHLTKLMKELWGPWSAYLCHQFSKTAALLRYNHKYHKINPYKVNNSVVFNLFTEFCNGHHDLISENFHHTWTHEYYVPTLFLGTGDATLCKTTFKELSASWNDSLPAVPLLLTPGQQRTSKESWL